MNAYYAPQKPLAVTQTDFTQFHTPALEVIDRLLDAAKQRLRNGGYPENEAMVWSLDWRAEMQSHFKRGMAFIEQIEASLLKNEAIGYEGNGMYVVRLK